MGRKIKRVAIDFSWPLKTPWKGFINQYHTAKQCEACNGSGYSSDAKRFSDEWYGHADFDPRSTGSEPFGWSHPLVLRFATDNITYDFNSRTRREPTPSDKRAIKREAMRLAEMWDRQWIHHLSQADVDALVADGRLSDFTSTFTPGEGWKPKEPPYRPTAKEVNEWSITRGIGHDAINQWVCVKARCKREGVSPYCSCCEGHGELWPSKADKKRYEDWQPQEPPDGDGWQLWETVSEGSPITPVFATPELLAEFCAKHQFDEGRRQTSGELWNILAGGTEKLSREQWLEFIAGPGWAPSSVYVDGDIMSGVAATAQTAEATPSKTL